MRRGGIADGSEPGDPGAQADAVRGSIGGSIRPACEQLHPRSAILVRQQFLPSAGPFALNSKLHLLSIRNGMAGHSRLFGNAATICTRFAKHWHALRWVT
jgi:hypothetical protein